MLDLYNLPYDAVSVQTFAGTSAATGVTWQQWLKPRGKTMAHIVLLGCGGNGGTGAIGANSTAAGGGGGGSGSQATLTVPLFLLPDVLYICLPDAGVGGAAVSYVSVYPVIQVNHHILTAKGGGNGGNASGATAGAAGAAGAITAIGNCPLAARGVWNFLAGQAGIIGAIAGNGASLTIPTTGLICTGGAGGGGLSSAGTSGQSGGSFTTPAAPSMFPAHIGGVGSATATAPADNGRTGPQTFNGLTFFYGGTGGSTTHGTATGAGLTQSKGGNGAHGSGGGGGGGALTGSAASATGKGGGGWCNITCW